MSETILLEKHPISSFSDSNIALIYLNDPKNLNAISHTMCQALIRALNNCREDDQIQAVVITGVKHFCAGGNIKDLHQAIVQEKFSSSDHATQGAYQLIQLLDNYPKPTFGFSNGITMGGGLGLFESLQYKILTPDSCLAMPETAIGLYPDVCAGFFLNRLPFSLQRFFSLTGTCIPLPFAYHYQLADAFFPQNDISSWMIWLKQALSSKESWQNAWTTLQTESTHHFKNDLIQLSNQFAIFNTEPQETLELYLKRISAQKYLTDDPFIQSSLDKLDKASPLLIYLTDAYMQYCCDLSKAQVILTDQIMSASVTRLKEALEGIRAKLIDKDNQPLWQILQPSEQAHIWQIILNKLNQV